MHGPDATSVDPPPAPGGRRAREPLLDLAAALAVWTVLALDLAKRQPEAGQSASSPTAYLLAGVLAAPLAVHRRLPLPATAMSTAGLIGYAAGRFSAFPGYATFALVFAVALHAGRRTALAAYLVSTAGLLVALLLQSSEVATTSSWISTVLTVTVAWLAGENLRTRREHRRHELDQVRRRAQQQEEEARRLSRQQAEDTRRAITAERLRIARDLHDVVAHAMSVIAVQAGAAHHVVDDRPEVARDALGSIESAARQGLVELRRMLGVLRSEDDPGGSPGLQPAEGLRDVERLLGQFRSAGLSVDVTGVDDVTGGLPPALDVSAYRIIQEGLTNVLRHGGPQAHLSVSRAAADLRIEIRDDGRRVGTGPAGAGSGHGLAGIRERVAVFDGTVRAGPVDGGGFRLLVDLPVGPSGAAR